jgi:hypothetical protein
MTGWHWSKTYHGLSHLIRNATKHGHAVWVTVDNRELFAEVRLVHLTVYHTDPVTFYGNNCLAEAKKEAERLASEFR